MNNSAIMKVQTAMNISATIIVFLRSQRSMNTPVKGPITSWGRSEAIVDQASTSADLVSMLSQKTTAYPTIELLSVEISCPVQIIPNTLFQSFID